MNRRSVGAILAAVCLCVILCLAGIRAFGPDPHYDFEPESEAVSPAETVFIAGSGSKFHREGCGSVTASDNVTQLEREAAEAAGYEPCQRCLP